MATARVTHYASLMVGTEEVFGTAELISGGYLFRRDGERRATLVSYKDADLVLYGRCDLADAQLVADGDRVVRCSQTLVADDGQLELFPEAA